MMHPAVLILIIAAFCLFAIAVLYAYCHESKSGTDSVLSTDKQSGTNSVIVWSADLDPITTGPPASLRVSREGDKVVWRITARERAWTVTSLVVNDIYYEDLSRVRLYTDDIITDLPDNFGDVHGRSLRYRVYVKNSEN